MADERPVRNYDGNYITCYPGSNQTDEGKLNLEYNMARLITRLSSKNFCVTKPSFELTLYKGSNGKPQIQVGEGQCSINGMDLIMSQTLTIDPPETAGTFYLAFKLARDSSDNVLGDTVYGVTKTFEGVYLTYFDEKPDPLTDMDMLYLGKVVYDGTDITELEEDEDKYGRIWAEDILCKIKDPKHPDISRLILQDWIYKVPDWYVSKEGDVEYGEIDFMAGRLTEGSYGIHIQAVDDNKSEFIMKAPSLSTEETNRILRASATDSGVQLDIGLSILKSNIENNYALELNTPNNILINSTKDVSLIGQNSISLGIGASGNTPKLLLQGNKATYTSTNASSLKDEVVFSANAVQHIFGKSILQYTESNSKLSLLSDDTNYFDILPNTDFTNSARVQNTLYIGASSTYGNDTTKLTRTQWSLVNNTSSSTITAGVISLVNPTANLGYLETKQSSSAYSKLYNTGKLELYNSGSTTQILLKDGSSGYDVSITKTNAAKTLTIDATQTNVSGDFTATGEIRAKRVWNSCYNDIVEFMEKADYDEVIEAGDIVYFDNTGKVTKYHGGISSTAIAGVVSSEETYGYALGGEGLDDNQKVPVALKGRVYVKTDNIMLQAGDIISVDACGCAYKGTYQDSSIFILGIATQPEKDGKVFIMLK
jgi:hypothetical protein